MNTQEYTIGATLPDLVVTDSDNMPSTLSKQMGERGLLLYVLRGTWCPFCVSQIHSMRRRYPRYQQLGVETVFIVPEPHANVYSFAISSPTPLPFGLHADENTELADSLTQPVDNPNDRPIGIYLLNNAREIVWRFVGPEDQGYPSQQDLNTLIEENL